MACASLSLFPTLFIRTFMFFLFDFYFSLYKRNNSSRNAVEKLFLPNSIYSQTLKKQITQQNQVFCQTKSLPKKIAPNNSHCWLPNQPEQLNTIEFASQHIGLYSIMYAPAWPQRLIYHQMFGGRMSIFIPNTGCNNEMFYLHCQSE